MRNPTTTFYRDAAGEWRWRLRSANGRVLASGEGFRSLRGARRSWSVVVREVADVAFFGALRVVRVIRRLLARLFLPPWVRLPFAHRSGSDPAHYAVLREDITEVIPSGEGYCVVRTWRRDFVTQGSVEEVAAAIWPPGYARPRRTVYLGLSS